MANASYELALRAKEGWEATHHCVCGTLFIAFSVEAMINHFGKEKIPQWNSQKGPRGRLHKQVFDSYEMFGYQGLPTYQTIEKCFELRDRLAHGKTIDDNIEIELPNDMSEFEVTSHIISTPSSAIRDISLNKLKQWIDIARKIQDDFDKAIGNNAAGNSYPLEVTGLRSWYKISSEPLII
ncbi:hypothetical protein ACJW8B_16310 [Plesiomonas shigelloides]|uniref:hypothetical protein n=1 Tax=Plesiomonas shigelloides TaxID=703 RepID=UPI00387F00CA